MNLTTSQISRAISHLEAHLRTRLLNRTTRTLALTEAGERYLSHCHRILNEIDQAEAEASGAQINPAGTLRVHSTSGFGQHHVVRSLLRFRQRYPSVRVDLTFSDTAPNLLEDGYDSALLLAPNLPDSAMIAHRLGRVVGVACASPAYVQQHGEPASLRDLRRHTCLQLTNPAFPAGKWIFDGHDGPQTVTPGPSAFAINDADALELAIRQGAGIGLLPVASALPRLRTGELVRVLPEFAMQALNVYAVYPSGRYVDAKIRAWIDFLREDMPPVFDADVAALGAFPVLLEAA
ncbi:DNA-binding transcriptional LysR family regulator [Paraburkholderia sp. GAS333]